MDDKNLLILLFNNNVLRTHLINYVKCICNSDAATSLLETSVKYFSEPTKSLNMTLDDLDVIFTAEYSSDSDEIKLWNEIKDLKISDCEIVEEVAIKYIKKQLKESFFAEAFTNDSYDLDKLEDLYKLLSNIVNSADEERATEDIILEDIDDCCSSCDNTEIDGVTFFDKRVSDTLSTKQFDCGTVNVIMGSPGRGKTQLILNQGVHVAKEGKYSLHIALGDLTKRQLILRILAIVTGKPIQQISLLSPDQFKSFMQKAKNTYPNVFKYLHCKTCLPNVFTGVEIIRQIEDLQKRKNVHYKQIVIDYDGNIETDLSSTSKSRTKNDDTKSMYYAGADIYNSFVSFAKRNDSVIWILSQPKVQYWSVDKIPLEALSDSSKKGHIIDFCMSISKKDPKDNEDELCTLYISKNRHGESNKVFKSKQIGACQRFEPIDKDYWG